MHLWKMLKGSRKCLQDNLQSLSNTFTFEKLALSQSTKPFATHVMTRPASISNSAPFTSFIIERKVDSDRQFYTKHITHKSQSLALHDTQERELSDDSPQNQSYVGEAQINNVLPY